tara:strand:- start:86 stop:964 length:879 start_codon:yes stop_codon:yes gene_type:complete
LDIRIQKLSQYIGAEVSGIDFSKPVDREVKNILNNALAKNVALVIKNQNFDADMFVNAASVFGKPTRQNFTKFACKEQPLVSYVSNTFKSAEGKRVYHSTYWHSDHVNRQEPPKYTALYALEMPVSGGGDTGVFNTSAAFESLPAEWQKKLKSLRGIHGFKGSSTTAVSHKLGVSRKLIEDLPVTHDLVRRHPDTGKLAIYLHQGKLKNFMGMQGKESQELISKVFDLTLKPEFIYRHQWRLGDMLIWDNRQSMHQSYRDYKLSETRTLFRIIGGAEKPLSRLEEANNAMSA